MYWILFFARHKIKNGKNGKKTHVDKSRWTSNNPNGNVIANDSSPHGTAKRPKSAKTVERASSHLRKFPHKNGQKDKGYTQKLSQSNKVVCHFHHRHFKEHRRGKKLRQSVDQKNDRLDSKN